MYHEKKTQFNLVVFIVTNNFQFQTNLLKIESFISICLKDKLIKTMKITDFYLENKFR